MSFPLHVGTLVLHDPPALAALVRRDSGRQSGTVVPGKRPAEWLMDLVGSGALERRLAIGLAAALLQHPESATICEGARLSASLREPVLGGVLVRALDGHDMGLLLQSDPKDPESSVEDTLLAAALATCNLDDPLVRKPLLERLRHAGLPDLEIPALCAHGDPEDLELWLPAALSEGISEVSERAIADRLRRADAGAEVLARSLDDWPALREAIRARAALPT